MRAFPTQNYDIDINCNYDDEGMDLRDYFAAKAMQASLIKQECNKYSIEQLCKGSYKIADEMMKARNG